MSNSTRIKLCGLSREQDIIEANRLLPEYIGFVFFKKSIRCVSFNQAVELKQKLDSRICAVGVFLDEDPDNVADLLRRGIIDAAQLHGSEDEQYIRRIQEKTGKPVIKAFRINSAQDILDAQNSRADMILLDSGYGTGKVFDWQLIQDIDRPYFLAGGLTPDNAAAAVRELAPFAVDVSSGIESNGVKDAQKMRRFVYAVRNAEREEKKHG